MQDLTRDVSKTNNVNEKVVEIDLIAILKVVWKKLWQIVLIALVCGGIMFSIAKFVIQPTYKSGFTAYINNRQSAEQTQQLTNSDISAQVQLASTYCYILTSNTVLTAAADSINLDYPYSKLASMVKASVKSGTSVIEVSVVSESKDLSYMLAKAISEVAPAQITDKVEGSSMKIVDEPVYPTTRHSPSISKYTIIGALAGALLMLIVILIRYFTDDTISSEADLESRFSLPIVGIIPDYTKVGKEGKGYYSYGYAYKRPSGSRGEKSDKEGKE